MSQESTNPIWERGKFSHTDWAHPELEFVLADGPEPGSYKGIPAMAGAWSNRLRPFEDYRVTATEFRELDDERVLAFSRSVRSRPVEWARD